MKPLIVILIVLISFISGIVIGTVVTKLTYAGQIAQMRVNTHKAIVKGPVYVDAGALGQVAFLCLKVPPVIKRGLKSNKGRVNSL